MVLGGNPDGAARNDEFPVEFDAFGGLGGILQAGGVRARHLVIGARYADLQGPPGNQGVDIAADAFASLAAVRHDERAAGHHEGGVGLDAGRGGQVGQVGVVHAAGNRQAGFPSVDAHRTVGCDGFLAVLADRYVQGAARQHDGVLSADAVPAGRGDGQGRAVQYADVIVGGDAGLARRGDVQGT